MSIDSRVFVVSLLGWSLIPMIMSVHVSLVIAGAVPVGDMHLLASTIQKAYAAFISLQWKSTCSTDSLLIPQRGQFQTASTNPCRDSLSLVGSTLFRSRHLNPLIMLFTRIDSPRQEHCACANAFCAVRLLSLHWKYATALKMGTWCTF